MNSIRFVATAALLAAGSTTCLFAQNTRATVTGKIVDNTKEPVIGALVTVKNESTGFTVSAATDANGNYTIREIPLGSPYTITAKYIGYGDQKRTGYSLNQGDMLRVDFTMSDQSQELKEIEVVANSLKKNVDNEGASTSVPLISPPISMVSRWVDLSSKTACISSWHGIISRTPSHCASPTFMEHRMKADTICRKLHLMPSPR